MNAIAELRYCCPTCRAVFRTGMARCPLDGTRLQETLDDPLRDTIIADRYLIEELIGEGAMGRVYRVRHKRVSRRFALKVLFGDHASDPTMRKRFAREAEAASRLAHPHVASVIDFGATTEGLLYLVMDYVEGRELADIIDGGGPMPAAQIIPLLRQMASGLAHAHEHGLIHRDFKSANVLVAGDGEAATAHIVDFGMAVLAEPEERVGVRLTTDGTMVGTLAYMAPEQAAGTPVDARTDLFSLGVVLYEMLAGVLPFEGPPLAMARQNLAVEPPPIHERVPGLAVSQVLERVSNKLMAKHPDRRYQSGHELIAALDEALAAEQARSAPAIVVAAALIDDDADQVPVPVPVSVPGPVSVPVPVSSSPPGTEADPEADAEPRSGPVPGVRRERSATLRVAVPGSPRIGAVPLSLHGRTLWLSVAGAVAVGFAITVLLTRGSSRGAGRASTPVAPGLVPTLAAPAPPPDQPPTARPDQSPTAAPAAEPVVAFTPPAPVSPAAARATALTAVATRPRAPRAATSERGIPAAAILTAAPTSPPEPGPTSNDPLVTARQRLAAGDTGGAIKLVERELLDTPGRPALYELLGDARARTGNRIAAIAAYRRYLALAGDSDRNAERVRGKLQKLGGL